MTVRILIAEDHAMLRHGLRALVESIPAHVVIDEATTGRDAIAKTLSLKPDLLLLDLSLPDIGGPDIISQIRRKSTLQKMIALSDSNSGIEASDALRAGCQGFLLKNTSFEEVALAIKTVMLGRRFISQDVTESLVGDLLQVASNPSDGRTTWNLLTHRERSVFKLIAQGRTNRATAEYLVLSPKTVEKHRANLMRKLELRSAVELSLLAFELGIVDRPEVSQSMRARAGQEALV